MSKQANGKGWNYSSLSLAYRCPTLYKYNIIDGLKSQQPEGIDMHFGSAIHLALEAILRKEDPNTVFNLYWDSMKDKPLKTYMFNWEALQSIGETFIARFERLHSKKFIPTAIEERMYTTLGEFEVEGTADFIGTYEGIPSIVDFKTSKTRYHKDKIECNEQMYLYAYMARKVLGFDVRQIVYYVFVKHPAPSIQVITFPLTQAKEADMLKNMEVVMRQLSTTTEWPKNRTNCSMGSYRCDFWDKCYRGA